MCTSFAVYAGRPIYGMNFDFPEVPVWLRIKPGAGGPVFYLCFEYRGGIHEVAGLNSDGLFSSAHILVAHFDITPPAGEPTVHPYEVFSYALQSARCVEEMLAFLGDRRLGYLPERKGHHFYADAAGGTCVLEPGPQGNLIYPASRPYRVMANRPMQKELEDHPRPASDRYQLATRLIQARLPRFTADDAWEVLQQAFLERGRFTTRVSIVCDPLAGRVYLSPERDFSRRWVIDLQQGCAWSLSGYPAERRISLDAGGVALPAA